MTGRLNELEMQKFIVKALADIPADTVIDGELSTTSEC